MRYARAIALTLPLLIGASACDEGGRTLRAFKVSDRGQLIGGPGAIGEVGDYLLENDQIRAVVLGPRTADHSAGPGIFGGGLADLDLVRTEEEFRGGKGLDSFAEMFPLANLKFQDPPDLGVEVISDGSDGTEARVRVTGRGSLIFQSIGLLFRLAGRFGIPKEVQGEFCFRTDYVIEPGKRIVLIETTLTGYPSGVAHDPNGPDLCSIDDDAAGDVLDLPGLTAQTTPGVFDVVFGSEVPDDGPADTGDLVGVIAGDFLYFGHTTSVFAPGVGFDKDRAFFKVAEAGTDTFSEPLSFPAIIGVGDRVSYAMGAANPLGDGRFGGEVLVPLFLSSATVAMTAALHCLRSTSDDDKCDRYRRWRFRRFVGIGEGDVASAWAPILKEQGEPTGRLLGSIHDGRDGSPAAGAHVYLLDEAALGAKEQELFARGELSYDAYRAALDRTARKGATGVLNQIIADRGTDPLRDGRFDGVVPSGRYAVVAFAKGHTPSNPVPVTVRPGGTTEVALTLPASGTLEWEARDETGRNVPVKVVVLPLTGGARVRPELGDPLLVDNIYTIQFSADGHGQVSLPAPGTYDVIVMRGFEYEVHREQIELKAGRTSQIQALVERTVDTTGWISADMHVHATPSFDSGVTLEERAITMAAEGVEYFVSTDHDVITDYRPAIREAGLELFVSADPGVETTTIELGHFIGFPLDYKFTGGPAHGAPDWWAETPHSILSSIRELGSRGPERTVITVPHPRDGFFGYFDQFGLDPFSLKNNKVPLLGQMGNALQHSPSCDFDSIEVLNGKRYELIRTPTIGEALGFMRERRCIESRWENDSAERIRKVLELNEKYTRLILERTPEEQAQWFLGASTCDVLARMDKDEGPCTWPSDEDPVELLRPCDDSPLEGVVDDWFGLLLATKPDRVGAPAHDQLLAPTGLANSDTHSKTTVEAGFPRNWVRVEGSPSRVDHDEIVDAVLDRKVTAGAGPFVELWVNGAGIGGVVQGNGSNRVHVKVQSPSWFAVTRVEVYRNAEIILERTLPADGSAREGAVDFDYAFEDDPGAKDVFYVAIALGTHPIKSRLSPYYTSTPIPPLQFSDAAVDALGSTSLGSLIGGGEAEVPRHGAVWPYSFTNPVWVDGDGQLGWTPPRADRLGFCELPSTDGGAAVPQQKKAALRAH